MAIGLAVGMLGCLPQSHVGTAIRLRIDNGTSEPLKVTIGDWVDCVAGPYSGDAVLAPGAECVNDFMYQRGDDTRLWCVTARGAQGSVYDVLLSQRELSHVGWRIVLAEEHTPIDDCTEAGAGPVRVPWILFPTPDNP